MKARVTAPPRVAARLMAVISSVALLIGIAACSSSGAGNAAGTESGSGSSGPAQSGSQQPSASSTAVPTTEPYAGQQVVPNIRAMLPDSLKNGKTITEYINIPYVPMEFYEPGGKTAIGIDVDLANAVAKVFGVKVSFHNVSFPNLFTGLQSGRTPYVISGAYDAPSRRDAYTYIDYMSTGTPIVTTKANAAKYDMTTFKTFCGKTLATGVGTDYIEMIKALSKKNCGSESSIRQVLANSNAEDEIDVTDGRAVALFGMGAEAAAWFVDHQDGGKDKGQWTIVGKNYYPTLYGAFVLKSGDLAKPMQAAIQELMDNGVYTKIMQKWDVTGQAISKATVNAGPPIP